VEALTRGVLDAGFKTALASALDQLRTVDAERLLKPLGRLDPQTILAVLQGLQDICRVTSSDSRDPLRKLPQPLV
jgi:hypothetical protein